MEIKRVGRNSPIKSEEKKSVELKKDFSQNFNFARDKRSEEELKRIQEDIKKKGARLVITKSYDDVKAYKNLIKEYLNSVLQHMYNIKKDISFWQTQYFITVETIDKKLEELTELLLQEEKDNLSIAGTIDEITGLVLDIYR